ncbi:MAG: AI-2E family transporter [Steroidobacteraceae bacterium]
MQSSFYRRTFQLGTAAILGYALYQIIAPLREEIGWAAVLAFILHPLHERLSRGLRGRRALSAGILTALTPFLVLAPLAVLGVVFAGQVARLIQYLRGGGLPSYADLVDRLSSYPVIGGTVAWARDNAAVSAAQVESWATDSLQSLLRSAATVGGNVALTVFGTLVGFFLMLFMLFFFLQDGRVMLGALTRLIPMQREQRAQLLKYLGDVTRAVVFGSVATALIQGLFVGVGFALAGVPSPVVYAVVASIAAFLPGGAALVLVPGVLYLVFTGHWGAGIFLACWAAALAIVENILRPLLTSHHVHVSTLAIFVGAIGGAAAYGILGLILGPVLLSFAVALVRFAQERRPADA